MPEKTESKVAERLAWMVGMECVVVIADGDDTWELRCTYRDTLPMGREYFMVFDNPADRMLIATTRIVSIHIENAHYHLRARAGADDARRT